MARPERPLHIVNAVGNTSFQIILQWLTYSFRAFGLLRTFRCELHDVRLIKEYDLLYLYRRELLNLTESVTT